jgi:hypothetical protein
MPVILPALTHALGVVPEVAMCPDPVSRVYSTTHFRFAKEPHGICPYSGLVLSGREPWPPNLHTGDLLPKHPRNLYEKLTKFPTVMPIL